METIITIFFVIGAPFLLYLAWRGMKWWYRDTIFYIGDKGDWIWKQIETFIVIAVMFLGIYGFILQLVVEFLAKHYIIGIIIFIIIAFILYSIFNSKPQKDTAEVDSTEEISENITGSAEKTAENITESTTNANESETANSSNS